MGNVGACGRSSEMSNPNQTNVWRSSSTDAGGTSATTQSSKSRRAAKRPHVTLLNGIPDSWSEQTTLSLACPICFDTFSRSQVTKCGNTFCNDYILKHIENQSRFPKCTVCLSKDDLTPNFAMNELIILGKKSKSIKLDPQGSSLNCSSDLRDSLLSVSNPVSSFSLNDVDILMAILQRKKGTFTSFKKIKKTAKQNSERELELINQDLQHASAYSAATTALKSDDGSTSVLDSSVVEGVGLRGGNARGGGRGGYNRGSQLIDYVNRFDRYCPWCGYIIFDSSLERPTQYPNTRCLRLLPMGRPMSNGFKRCPRCWLLTHRSFLVCETCGRQRPAHEVHLNNVNVQGVDPMFVNVHPQPPGPPIDMGNDPDVDAAMAHVPKVNPEDPEIIIDINNN
ncbi:unnamed protein product [Allacma fusca]|uniref:RING-type domain-containing protein n=1 Tax=Allacma fusca TaxID=39272 RepID=A0A8J2KQE7_9HEXA|nr:unnamed protein product [Allacma fusca]